MASEETEQILKYLKALPKKAVVLDVGTGHEGPTKYLAEPKRQHPDKTFVGVDLDLGHETITREDIKRNMPELPDEEAEVYLAQHKETADLIRASGKIVQLAQADGRVLPVKPNSVHLLTTFRADRSLPLALAEYNRILKPGGIIITESEHKSTWTQAAQKEVKAFKRLFAQERDPLKEHDLLRGWAAGKRTIDFRELAELAGFKVLEKGDRIMALQKVSEPKKELAGVFTARSALQEHWNYPREEAASEFMAKHKPSKDFFESSVEAHMRMKRHLLR